MLLLLIYSDGIDSYDSLADAHIYHIVQTVDRATNSIKTITKTSLRRKLALPTILLGRL